MLLTILLILKILLFMNITKVRYNGLIIFSISTLTTLFFFTLIYFSNNKKKQTLAFSFYNTMSGIMFADVMYYTYFNALPSIKMLKQLNQVAAVGDSVKSIFTFTNFLFLMDIPLLMIYSKKKKAKIIEKNKKYSKYIRWGVPSGIALVIVFILIFLSSIELFGPVTNQELYTYHAKDIKKTIMGEEEIAEGVGAFTQEDLDELKERTHLDAGKYTGIGKGKNLIVIQVESLQNFAINHYYEGQEITPNLNKLINEKGSLYFDNYYQLIGRGNTSDAEFVSNNSLYPSMGEPTYTQYEKNTFYGLPWILRDNGYTSWAFHGYDKDFWNRKKAYVNQGFQRFIGEEDFDINESIGFGITDKAFLNQSMDYLKELDNVDENPFHAFIITLTSHNPYKMPEKYQVLNIKEEHKDTILGRYLQAVHYTDEALGQFIDDLKESGLYDNTVIAIYGDHFGISSVYKPAEELMTDYLGYKYDLDEMMNIPLIVHVPGMEKNETISKVGSQLDFAPTILNIMGLQNEKGIMFGRDLINYKGESLIAPQTYALKGSVINDDILLDMSRDGIFENSRAFKLKDREPVDVNQYRKYYEKAIEEINKSDFILRRDLLKDMIEDGDINLNELVSTEVLMDKVIKETNSTIEGVDEAFKEGYTTMAVDLKLNKDGELILGDDIPFEDLAKWLEENNGSYIVARTKEDNTDIFINIMEEFPSIKDRIIPEIYMFEEYHPLASRKYKNIILNIQDADYSDELILDFIDRHSVPALAMDKERGKTDLPKKMKEKGTITYVYDINSKTARKKLTKKQVFGVYTDKLK